jgi:hypothetical protein
MQCQSVDINIKQLGQQAAFILTLCNQEPSRIYKIAPRVQNYKQIAIVDTQSLGCGQKCKLQMSTIARGEKVNQSSARCDPHSLGSGRCFQQMQ